MAGSTWLTQNQCLYFEAALILYVQVWEGYTSTVTLTPVSVPAPRSLAVTLALTGRTQGLLVERSTDSHLPSCSSSEAKTGCPCSSIYVLNPATHTATAKNRLTTLITAPIVPQRTSLRYHQPLPPEATP
eukprot:CAMPEP_0172002676 /NCGR_PEP_ID=MMETSP1041-20130122/3534_1 /TAXON_ID=464988 /ORGANISM="Hemiselmis andersenii, Strain CCMP439" /LENGTH=129 /DNA_ID=CAMNT_0012656407 /DNA_START=421 /DNA_END=807 /DNA_ORIENTATION=+